MFVIEISGPDGTRTWERQLRDEAVELARTELRDRRPTVVARVVDKTTGTEVWSASKDSSGIIE